MHWQVSHDHVKFWVNGLSPVWIRAKQYNFTELELCRDTNMRNGNWYPKNDLTFCYTCIFVITLDDVTKTKSWMMLTLLSSQQWAQHGESVNSLIPGKERVVCLFDFLIFSNRYICIIDSDSTKIENPLMCIPGDLIGRMSTLDHVMAWCH